MKKTQGNISVSPDVWEEMQRRYPRQVSQLIEEYMRMLLDFKETTDFKEKSETISKKIFEDAEERRIKNEALKKAADEEKLLQMKYQAIKDSGILAEMEGEGGYVD